MITRFRLLASTAAVLVLAPQISAPSLAQETAVLDGKVPAVKVDPSPLPQAPGTVSTFAPVVEKVASSVVTIATSKMIAPGRGSGQPNEEMLRRFFGMPDEGNPDPRDTKPGRKRKQLSGLGSGVVVSAEGHILTNNHVIQDADEIIVTVGNEKHEYKAKKIGTDPGTDIAVLKIEPIAKLQPITFADSDKIRVGDLAIAVGNPFGLTQSVTMGIVSATGRGGTGITDFENFIQTDASINPGNSGGALVDSAGRLIGVNTAIFSRSGGNMGIGFAVPANLAHSVMESIIKTGRVSRGFLGLSLQPLSDELAKAFHIETDSGALVAQVSPGSPSEKAGILSGDVVIGLNDKKVEGTRELMLMVAAIAPGTKVEVKVLRDAKERVFTAVLGERPTPKLAANEPEKSRDPDVLDGVSVGDIDADARKKYEVPESAKGVVITEIDADSPSAEAGLKVGDVVDEINRESITSSKQAVELSEKLKKETKVLVRVTSKNSTRYVVIERKD